MGLLQPLHGALLPSSYPLAGRRQLLQQEGDGDLQQGLPEELLAHGAAVVVVFLRGRRERLGQRPRGLQGGVGTTPYFGPISTGLNGFPRPSHPCPTLRSP